MAPAEHTKNPERVAAGLRASLRNKNVSDEAKAHINERLQEMESHGSKHKTTDQSASGSTGTSSHDSHVLGGYKATLHNKNASEDAKKHAREILTASGYTEFEKDETAHNTRVLAGYKAALHNPNVSEEAKQHAREYLKEHESHST
ncbi:hypothetical protein H0H92_002940 [Tricholoma furcatifolium]|nr:hypothetical protein H0H92_002940 [Tricholoma furcatifolium]